MVCDSIESPRKLYVWGLEGGTAFTVGTLVEANWPSPETGRSGLQAHFTPDGLILSSCFGISPSSQLLATFFCCCFTGLPAHEMHFEQRGGALVNDYIFGSLNSVAECHPLVQA